LQASAVRRKFAWWQLAACTTSSFADADVMMILRKLGEAAQVAGATNPSDVEKAL
jgi:hypothetical protein